MEEKPFYETIIGAIHICLGEFYWDLSSGSIYFVASGVLCKKFKLIKYFVDRATIPQDKMLEIIDKIGKISDDVAAKLKEHDSSEIQLGLKNIMSKSLS